MAACSDRESPFVATAPGAAPVLSAANAIDGSYIVVLKQGADPRSVAAAAGVSPKHIYTAALNGFAGTLNAGQLNALRHNPRVKYIEQDQAVALAATQTGAPWGLDRIDQRDMPLSGTYTYTATGTGVRAYIIDSGIRTGHAQFGGRASIAWDGIGDGSQDCNGHGTHVAGTVGGSTYGVAKGVTLIGVRVFACGNTTPTSTIIAGINWTAANAAKPAVANLSLGGVASTTLDDAVRGLFNAGVVPVVAAGNDSQSACNASPARTPEAITVGATTSADARASFSNWGSCLDLFAPGDSITSAWPTSTTAVNTLSGTSMAAPHAAGVAALYLQNHPSATPASVASFLVNSATPNKVTNAGTGSPNRLLYSPPPVTLEITGPTQITSSGLYTWYANASGGDGTYTYVWEYREAGGAWTTFHPGQGYARSVAVTDPDFEFRVTVTSAGYTAVDTHSVTVGVALEITGPTQITSAGIYYWYANASGGDGTYTYVWEFREAGGTWSTFYPGQGYARSVAVTDPDFEFRVTVTSGGATATDGHSVHVQ